MTTEADVLAILKDPHRSDLRWSLQGFGMLRTYLAADEVERLHIWDIGMSVEDVSTVHDHPWDLDSLIISGRLQNQRFVRSTQTQDDLWNFASIRTGEGGHILNVEPQVRLAAGEVESYGPGERYHQDAPEIHESTPDRGTVTLVNRTFSQKRDVANVYWIAGEWGSAEPRPATPDEVQHFVDLALSKWSTS